jgi:hypothetical protein
MIVTKCMERQPCHLLIILKNRVAFITLIGGKLISNKDTFEQMSNILRHAGATKIQGMARPAIARLWKRYGFEERTTLVEVKL